MVCSGAALHVRTIRGAETDWPAITSPETKAWTRWWWHGSAVTKADLTAVMEQYAAAGLGGLEITPIYGVRGGEREFIPYLSPQWVEMFDHVLREADRLGMRVDMSTGNGWPFGGNWVDADAACRNLVLETYEVAGGASLDRPVRSVQRPLVRAIGRRVAIEDLREPLADNDDLQGMALEQVRFEKPLPLLALVACGPDGQRVNLTERVDAEGRLDWTAPDGDWTLYAAFLGWHGKMVERAGPGGEGHVIDHFSRPALDAYLKRFDDALAGRHAPAFRAYFNDSYEVDDAAGNSDATPGIFAEFRRRRGYDLRDHLPALAGRASRDENARVLCDYRETISDLLLDNFTKPWTEWARRHGALTRDQAHGSPASLLDLYAASDIPECEGRDRIAFITAASAAHVTGKPLVSAEACTWLDEHFLGTIGDAKQWCDDYFLGGVNHICYHGTCYSPPDEDWPGRLFYAALELQPTNPQWAHFKALNDYVARCQSFLQAGHPDDDVLVYYPIHDEWSRSGRTRLAHFNGSAQGTPARRVGEQLLADGYLFAFLSDRQLQTVDVIDGLVAPPGNLPTKAIVIPPCTTMPIESLRKLAALAAAGASIIAPRDWAPDVAGLADLDARRMEARALVARICQGAGFQTIPEGSTAADALHGVAHREDLPRRGLSFIRRRHDNGYAYFIVNAADKRFDDWALVRKAGSAVLFNPLTGDAGLASVKAVENAGTMVRLQLEPGEACIVRTYDGSASGAAYPYVMPTGNSEPIAGRWKLEFTDGGPKLPAAIDTPTLTSWTEYGGDDVKRFSGVGRYAIQFARPAKAADAWLLDLGGVRESAAVRLNGEPLGTVFSPPFRMRIPTDQLRDANALEIDVANLMANRIADLDRRGVQWQRFYNVNIAPRRPENRGPGGVFSAARWTPRPSGLLGPVTLTPVALGPTTTP
jgi:hypothetical protein